jgi:hypothetical protein
MALKEPFQAPAQAFTKIKAAGYFARLRRAVPNGLGNASSRSRVTTFTVRWAQSHAATVAGESSGATSTMQGLCHLPRWWRPSSGVPESRCRRSRPARGAVVYLVKRIWLWRRFGDRRAGGDRRVRARRQISTPSAPTGAAVGGSRARDRARAECARATGQSSRYHEPCAGVRDRDAHGPGGFTSGGPLAQEWAALTSSTPVTVWSRQGETGPIDVTGGREWDAVGCRRDFHL